ncbi:MAG: hypothetical protein K1X44_04995 [Alphaproteobacteria bacterium]|nr:hypothetical protein [Alphaproteobacteria bacterium]
MKIKQEFLWMFFIVTNIGILTSCSSEPIPVQNSQTNKIFSEPAPPTENQFGPISTRIYSDVIEIKVVDRYGITDANLTLPSGKTIPALHIDRTNFSEQVRRPSRGISPSFGIGVGVFGGSSGGVGVGSGIGIGIPLGSGSDSDDDMLDSPQTRSVAVIKIPDLNFYKENWENSKIRVGFSSFAHDNRVIEVPAPKP